MNEKLKEFDLLLLEYKEGNISDENFDRLQSMLREDESLREHYAQAQAQALDAMLSIEEEFALPEEIYSKSLKPVKGNFSIIYAVAALFVVGFIIASKIISANSVPKPVMAYINELGAETQIIRNNQLLNVKDLKVLFSGDKIKTKGKNFSLNYFKEGTTVVLTENSEAIFETVGGAKVIHLKSGDVICDVDKQPPGKPMKIYTPHAEATVLGTQFLLSAEKDFSKLHVNEGAVEFKDKATNKSIEAKAGWTTRISIKAGIKSFQKTIDSALIKINDFTLINAETNKPFPQFDPIPQDSIISLSELGTNKINILVNVELKPRYVGGVRFYMDAKSPEAKKIKIYDPRGQVRNRCGESIYPFMFAGDTDDEPVKARVWEAVPGTFKLKAVPYGDKRSKGISGKPSYVNFQIVE